LGQRRRFGRGWSTCIAEDGGWGIVRDGDWSIAGDGGWGIVGDGGWGIIRDGGGSRGRGWDGGRDSGSSGIECANRRRAFDDERRAIGDTGHTFAAFHGPKVDAVDLGTAGIEQYNRVTGVVEDGGGNCHGQYGLGGDDAPGRDGGLGAAGGIVVDAPATDIDGAITGVVELYPFGATTRRR